MIQRSHGLEMAALNAVGVCEGAKASVAAGIEAVQQTARRDRQVMWVPPRLPGQQRPPSEQPLP